MSVPFESGTLLLIFMLPCSVLFIFSINIPSLSAKSKKAQSTTLPLQSCHILYVRLWMSPPVEQGKCERISE
jgi:hypothetical protein